MFPSDEDNTINNKPFLHTQDAYKYIHAEPLDIFLSNEIPSLKKKNKITPFGIKDSQVNFLGS